MIRDRRTECGGHRAQRLLAAARANCDVGVVDVLLRTLALRFRGDRSPAVAYIATPPPALAPAAPGEARAADQGTGQGLAQARPSARCASMEQAKTSQGGVTCQLVKDSLCCGWWM